MEVPLNSFRRTAPCLPPQTRCCPRCSLSPQGSAGYTARLPALHSPVPTPFVRTLPAILTLLVLNREAASAEPYDQTGPVSAIYRRRAASLRLPRGFERRRGGLSGKPCRARPLLRPEACGHAPAQHHVSLTCLQRDFPEGSGACSRDASWPMAGVRAALLVARRPGLPRGFRVALFRRSSHTRSRWRPRGLAGALVAAPAPLRLPGLNPGLPGFLGLLILRDQLGG